MMEEAEWGGDEKLVLIGRERRIIEAHWNRTRMPLVTSD